MLLRVILVAVAMVNLASCAYCNGKPDEGERTNDFPIWDGKLRHGNFEYFLFMIILKVTVCI